jgi:GT2 family glycosyltransferase
MCEAHLDTHSGAANTYSFPVTHEIMGTDTKKASVDYRERDRVATRDAQPVVSIVFLNYRTPGLLKYCLRRFMAMRYPFAHEFIVVDNASADGSVAMIRAEYPAVRLIASDENNGFASGNNQGIRAARGRYVMIVNPDIVPRPYALEQLVAFLDDRPNVAMVGPRLTNPDGSVQDSCYRFPSMTIPIYRRTLLGRTRRGRQKNEQYCMRDTLRDAAQPVDWLLGACILVRKDVLDTVGLMDEQFFLYYEDTDWCRRFWNSGYEVWHLPHASMVHYHRRESADAHGIAALASRMTRIHIISGMKYFWKWRGK